MMLRNYVMPPLPVAPSSCERAGPIILRNCLKSGPMMLRTGTPDDAHVSDASGDIASERSEDSSDADSASDGSASADAHDGD
jgi:hypothetical protein